MTRVALKCRDGCSAAQSESRFPLVFNMLGVWVHSCESTTPHGAAPEITGAAVIEAQIKYLNRLIERRRRSCDVRNSRRRRRRTRPGRNATEQMEPGVSPKCISRPCLCESADAAADGKRSFNMWPLKELARGKARPQLATWQTLYFTGYFFTSVFLHHFGKRCVLSAPAPLWIGH